MFNLNESNENEDDPDYYPSERERRSNQASSEPPTLISQSFLDRFRKRRTTIFFNENNESESQSTEQSTSIDSSIICESPKKPTVEKPAGKKPSITAVKRVSYRKRFQDALALIGSIGGCLFLVYGIFFLVYQLLTQSEEIYVIRRV